MDVKAKLKVGDMVECVESIGRSPKIGTRGIVTEVQNSGITAKWEGFTGYDRGGLGHYWFRMGRVIPVSCEVAEEHCGFKAGERVKSIKLGDVRTIGTYKGFKASWSDGGPHKAGWFYLVDPTDGKTRRSQRPEDYVRISAEPNAELPKPAPAKNPPSSELQRIVCEQLEKEALAGDRGLLDTRIPEQAVVDLCGPWEHPATYAPPGGGGGHWRWGDKR